MTVPSAPIPEAIPSVGEIWVRAMSKRVTLISRYSLNSNGASAASLVTCSEVKQSESYSDNGKSEGDQAGSGARLPSVSMQTTYFAGVRAIGSRCRSKSAGQPHAQQAAREAVSVAKMGAFGSRIRIAPSFWQAFRGRVRAGRAVRKAEKNAPRLRVRGTNHETPGKLMAPGTVPEGECSGPTRLK